MAPKKKNVTEHLGPNGEVLGTYPSKYPNHSTAVLFGDYTPAEPKKETPKKTKKTAASTPTKKDLGALKALEYSPEDIERISSLPDKEFNAHVKKYHPDINGKPSNGLALDTLMKRRLELKSSQPKAPKSTVFRDPKTGRATPKGTLEKAPAVDADPVIDRTVGDSKLKSPTQKKLGLRKNKTGTSSVAERKAGIRINKVRDRKRKPQKSLRPQVGQAGSLDGKVVRVTEENLNQVSEQKLHTILPDAGREVMEQPSRPVTQTAIMPSVLPGSQSGKRLGGFAATHEIVKGHTNDALKHLQTMANSPKGSPEHHAAHEAFNVSHALIGQTGNKALHDLVGLGRKIVQENHGSPNMENGLKTHRALVTGMLEAGRLAEETRKDRSGKNVNRKPRKKQDEEGKAE